MRRLVLVVLCALALPVSVARAWTWPVDGPVLRPFVFDNDSPYKAGQHRGIDLGASTGTPVLAPAEGVVSFAGTVPTGGKTISIQTPFGYTATLLHLGTIGVKRGAVVREGSVVGAVGTEGDAQPYVYFGVRTTSDAQGYVDPLGLLPARPAVPATAPAVEEPAQPVQPAEPVVPPAATGPTGAPAQPASESLVEQVATEAVGEQPEAAPEAEGVPASEPLARAPATAPRAGRRAGETSSRGARPSVATPRPTALRDRAGRARTVRMGAGRTSDVRIHADAARPTRAGRGGSTFGTLRIWLLFAGALLVCVLAFGARRQSVRRAARIMFGSKPERSVVRTETREDPRRAGLAVRIGEAAPGPRGRVRGAGRHLRALPPVEGQRRADGERDGRAWNAGDGDGGSRGRLAA